MLKFRRLSGGETVSFEFHGRPLTAVRGDSVAAALLATGIDETRRTPKLGRPRAPYCLMGSCHECLMVIDGVANRQACLVTVREGMSVERQRVVHGSHWA